MNRAVEEVISVNSTTLAPTVYSVLRPHQKPHVETLTHIFEKRLVGYDPSDPGTGKTFCYYGVAENLWKSQRPPGQKVRLAIVCPNNIFPEWVRITKRFEHLFDVVLVCNLDKLARGNWIPWCDLRQADEQVIALDASSGSTEAKIDSVDVISKKLKSQSCPYVQRVAVKDQRNNQDTSDFTFVWKLPKFTHVVFDEAHRCREDGTGFNKLLTSLIETNSFVPIQRCPIRIQLVTATLTENPKSGLTMLLYMLQLIRFKSTVDAKRLLNQQPLRGQMTQRDAGVYKPYTNSQIDMRVMHHLLFHSENKIASRMTSEQAHANNDPNNPNNVLKLAVTNDARCEAYQMDFSKQSAISDSLARELEILQEHKRKTITRTPMTKSELENALTRLLKERREKEFAKLETIVYESLVDYEQGYNVAIFVNFRVSLQRVKALLEQQLPRTKRFARDKQDKVDKKIISTNVPDFSIVMGGQKDRERDYNIRLFEKDQTPIFLGTIGSAGTSISLHDTIGNHPRSTKISPPISATALVQCLGRVYRSGVLTNCKQRIIFCKGTVEERVANLLDVKIRGMDMINQGFVSDKTKTIFDWAQEIADNWYTGTEDNNNNNSYICQQLNPHNQQGRSDDVDMMNGYKQLMEFDSMRMMIDDGDDDYCGSRVIYGNNNNNNDNENDSNNNNKNNYSSYPNSDYNYNNNNYNNYNNYNTFNNGNHYNTNDSSMEID